MKTKSFLPALVVIAILLTACGNSSTVKKEEKTAPDTMVPVNSPVPADTTPPLPVPSKKQEPVPEPAMSRGNIPVPVPGLPPDTGKVEKHQENKQKQ